MSRARAVLLTLGAVAGSAGMGFLLLPQQPGAGIRFLLFIPPILIGALVGGFLPAMLAAAAGAVLAELFFRQPYFSLDGLVDDAYLLLLYGVIAAGIAGLATELGRTRAKIQRQSREFDTLFKLTPLGIGVANDPACRDIRVNPAFAEMLHITPDTNASLTSLSPRQLPFRVEKDGVPVAPDDLPLQKAARLGTELKHIELDLVFGDGAKRVLYEFAAPLFDEEGQVRGAIGAFLDITELKEAEARLRHLADENERLYREALHANRLKDEFLATLSHELRTPLNALLGWTHLIKSGHLDAEKFARALAAIERSAQAQAQLTADLLDISGIITGKLRLNPEPTLLQPLVADVMETLGPAALAKGVTCREATAVEEPQMVDPARIRQILLNLVSNAIKFTPAGGAIDVSVRREADDLILRVTDTGLGISPEFLPHVFDRFRQADAGPTRSVGGLGLGLSIVKELTERHGGWVTADSAGPGKGATFTVRLPVRTSALAEGRAISAAGSGSREH